MRRKIQYSSRVCLVLGCCLLLIGLGLALIPVVTAQTDKAEYSGSSDCNDCHRVVGRHFENSAHDLALIDVTS